MKICLTTSGNSGLKESLDCHFGAARFFNIYDTETKKLDIIENNNDHHSHGTCQPLAAFEHYNIDVVLTSGMGKKAVEILNSNNIKVFRLEGTTVEDAIQKFEKNELTELTVDSACGGHGCH